MNLQFLGGAGEIGRSALLVDDSLLLDYGMATTNPPSYPVGRVSPDAVVVSHGHLDHVGALPALMSANDRPEVHWTAPTREFALTLARDTLKLHGGTMQCPFTETDVRRLTQQSRVHGYGESFEAAGYEVTFFEAGHIPGSAHVLVSDSEVRRTADSRTRSGDGAGRGSASQSDATVSDDGDTRLLYTGDFHTDSQRLVRGSTDRPDADVVVCESTYADVTHDPREQVERRFAQSLRDTVAQGGTVVVPAFAIGRTQEVLMLCERYDLECYVDGMGMDLSRMLRNHPDHLRDPEAFSRAVSHARFVTSNGQRERVAAQNTVIVTTSGMLSGGPAMTYVPAIRGSPVNLVAFVGYQVEGTTGRRVLETGRGEFDGRVLPISARTDLFELSAHADSGGLRAFLEDYEDARVLVNHGDRCAWFAEQLRADGFDASAPELGDSVEV